MSQFKFYIKDIESKSVVVDMLTVLSYEMSIYLVELNVGGLKGLIYENDKPKRFHSGQHIRNTFEKCTIFASQMLHESPYDEMIGNPASAQETSMLPFSMRQPY